jgi:phenylalanyl-tRNA synthetase alpha subunit
VSKIKTIEGVREFARKFQSVIDLADALEPIANLELAEAELRGQVQKLQGERDKALAEVTDAKAKAAALVSDAEAKAKAVTGEAEKAAKDQADAILDQARGEAGKASDKAKADAKKSEKRVADLQAQEADLDRDIAARKAELEAAELEARLIAERVDLSLPAPPRRWQAAAGRAGRYTHDPG